MVYFLQLLHFIAPELWDKAIHAVRKSLVICGVCCSLLNLCIVILLPSNIVPLLFTDSAAFFGMIYLAMKIYESNT